MRKEQSNNRAIRIILTVFCVLFIVGSVCVFCVGAMIRLNFDAELPENFLSLTVRGVAPKFYCYRFEDRENRIGEAVQLSKDFCSADETEHVSYAELPRHVMDAFIAIEDKRFYSHRGVDWYRTVAAALNYAIGASDSFGASTVTQQLIKNLTGNTEVTLRRKLQEILYAVDLERTLDKTEILENYLNVINFADRCNGIGAAAKHYFSKRANDLTLTEAATLAAIINNPTYYHPIRNPENNMRRRNLILSEMRGQGMINEEAYQLAIAQPLGLRVQSIDADGVSSWYADMVVEDVVEDLCQKYGMSRSAASGLVYSGGLYVYTALDEQVQKTVEAYYEGNVRLPTDTDGNSAQSAIVVLDSKTGDILGVAGAVGKKRGSRVQNFATQTKRPPGSAIKPITVYAQALERGLINWASVYDDVPVDFGKSPNEAWPRNANNSYRGLTTIADSMGDSTNTVAVKVLEQVGLRESFETARSKYRLVNLYEDKERTDCDRAALALGQLHYGVTLRELATAYTPFADEGVFHESRSYFRVLDADGHILLSKSDMGDVVLSQGNAAVMTQLMKKTVEEGTASAVTLKKIVECAGKTGTTNRDCDRWFIGYTPELICGVWSGFEYPVPMSGKNPCLRIWDDVMTSIFSKKGGERKFSIPNSLVRVSYCKDSGMLPCEACALDPRGGRVEEGWFVRGTEPKSLCDCHVICNYDAVCGGVAHVDCPVSHRQRVALIRVERNFPYEVTVVDAQYVYGGEPLLTDRNENDKEPYFAHNKEGFSGRSRVEKPYNRSCPVHETTIDELPWWKRYFDGLDVQEIE